MTIAFVLAEHFAKCMNADNGAESLECLQTIIVIVFSTAVPLVLDFSAYCGSWKIMTVRHISPLCRD